MVHKLLMEQPTRYDRQKTDDGNGYVMRINEGWIADDDDMFTRLLRKEIVHYTDGHRSPDEPEIVITSLETISGTSYMLRKLSGNLFTDIQEEEEHNEGKYNE